MFPKAHWCAIPNYIIQPQKGSSMHATHLYFNGAWVEGEGAVLASRNPATQEIIWEGQAAAPAQVSAAVEGARQAFEGWSGLEAAARIQYLRAFSEQLENVRAELAETISKETGKPLWESLAEVSAMRAKVEISIEAHAERCHEQVRPHASGVSVTRHRPHGVLAVFGPYNFPGHLPNGHIVPALLAGNTVVFKPSEYAPMTAALVTRCWERSGLHQGVFNLLQGGREVGQALALHPGVDGLLFTGSWETGRHLAQLFASQPGKIVALEMGGNNPLVIGRVGDLEAAAQIVVQSAFLTSGQRCTCARRLIVPRGEPGDALIKLLQQKMAQIDVGPYTKRPEPFMGPLVSTLAADKVLQKYRALLSYGAIPLVPLERLALGPAFLSPGLLDVTAAAPRPDEEIFGPLLQLIRVDNLDAALAEANRTAYGLAAGIVSDDAAEYRAFYAHIKAGVVNWNMPLTGASSHAPFGGVKQSGNYRPSAYYAADYCSYPVASLERVSVHSASGGKDA